LRDEPKWRSLHLKSAAIWRLRIRTILLATALSTFASSAFAQYGAPGGFVPYTFDAPAAAGAAPANTGIGDDSGGRCYVESHGRGGAQRQCEDQPSVAPKK
jgi:hypothetical protein